MNGAGPHGFQRRGVQKAVGVICIKKAKKRGKRWRTHIGEEWKKRREGGETVGGEKKEGGNARDEKEGGGACRTRAKDGGDH